MDIFKLKYFFGRDNTKNFSFKSTHKEMQLEELTFGNFEIHINGNIITTNYNVDTKEIKHSIYVPMYYIAEWFAFNWFRIFYEQEIFEKDEGSKREVDWKMVHHFTSIDHGYRWPFLSICNYNKNLVLFSMFKPHNYIPPSSPEWFHYTNNCETLITSNKPVMKEVMKFLEVIESRIIDYFPNNNLSLYLKEIKELNDPNNKKELKKAIEDASNGLDFFIY